MIIPAGFAQVNVIMGGTALPLGAQWTFGVELNEAGPLTPTAIATAVAGAITSSTLMTNFSDAVNTTGILVKVGPNATGPSALLGSFAAGTLATTTLPPNTAALVRKNTAMGGRAGRGRMYLPGLIEGEVSQGGTITGARASALQADLDAFLAALNTANLTPMLLHGAAGGPITEPLEILSFSLDTKVATQRRRLRR